MPTFADLLTPGIGSTNPSQDQPENPDEQPPSRSRSTATAPIGQGPMETVVTPPWDTTARDANAQSFAGLDPLIHKLGLDRDYLTEARNMLPAPPPAPTMNKGSWAALGIPAAVAALTGGPMGLAAAGNAVGQAGITNAAQRRQAWEDQLKYAGGVGALANQMQQRGTQLFSAIAPYEGMKAYEASRIQQEDMTRQAHVAQWHEQNRLAEARLSQDLSKFAQTEQDKALVREEMRARDEAATARDRARDLYNQGHLDLARQQFALAERKDAEAQANRSRLIDIAVQNVQAKRDTQSLGAAKSVLASLIYEENSDINTTSQAYAMRHAEIVRLQTAIEQMGNVPVPAPGGGGHQRDSYPTTHSGTLTVAQVTKAIQQMSGQGMTRQQIHDELQRDGIPPQDFGY